jgi:hypothetical protein
MFSAAVRLLKITLMVVSGLYLVVLGLGVFGRSIQEAPPFSDEFYGRKTWIIRSAVVAPTDIPALTVQRLIDGTLVVAQNLPTAGEAASAPTLTQTLSSLKSEAVFLFGKNLTQLDGARFLSAVKDSSFTGKVLVHVYNQALRKKLKEAQPLWIYGNTPSELAKLRAATPMGLSGVFSFDADFFVVDSLNPIWVDEVHRRKRKILLRGAGRTFDLGPFDGVILD